MNKKSIRGLGVALMALVMSFVLVMGSVSVVMAQNDEMPLTVEEQIQAILNDSRLTEEEKQFHISRFSLFEFSGDLRTTDVETLPYEIRSWIEHSSDNMSARGIPWTGGSLPVRHFRQATNWWCGPATGLQSLHYLNRNFPNNNTSQWYDQRRIAHHMQIIGAQHLNTPVGSIPQGTGQFLLPDIPLIIRFVNQNTLSRHRYITPAAALTNENTINSNIFLAIRYLAVPPIVRIQEVPGWPYQTRGHFLNISGMQTGANGRVSHVEFTDPLMGTQFIRLNPGHTSNANGVFWTEFSVLFRAMTASTNRNWAW